MKKTFSSYFKGISTTGLYLCLALSENANAHLLKVFAFSSPSNNQQIEVTGKVYFAGGAGVPQLTINVLDNKNTSVLKPITNANGAFSFKLPAARYEIVANSQDGHVAKWVIKAGLSSTKQPSKSSNANKQHSIDLQDDALQQLIERAVAIKLAEQIKPLSEQLNAMQEKVKYQDILGALGYIFGLFGVVMWVKQRKVKPITTKL